MKVGEKMRLRKLQSKDAKGMLEWMKEPTINQYFRFDSSSVNRDTVEQFIIDAQEKFEKNETYHYAIVDEGNEYLGTVSLKDIDHLAKTAEYAISLRKCAQGKGIGSWATREILRIAFEEKGLHRVYLNVLTKNKMAIKMYKKCGFIYEGEFKEHLFIKGELQSLQWYAMLYDEYKRL